MAHDHHDGHEAHHHYHDHAHQAPHHASELSPMKLRVRALESVLVEKGYVDPAALDALIETYETKVGPHNGARAVARAWVDPAFRARLLADATPALRELGICGRGTSARPLRKRGPGRQRADHLWRSARPAARAHGVDPARRGRAGRGTELLRAESAEGLQGRSLVGVRMDREGLMPDYLDVVCQRTKAKVLFCTPTLHNPTTATMS